MDCLIGLGSNVGNRTAQLSDAISQFCGNPQIEFISVSNFYETDPVGGPSHQPRFLNAALRVECQLTPSELLAWSQQIEHTLGRERLERWGPRVIDVDLLLCDQLVLEEAELTLPHPRMAVRRFVLEPANEIAGDMTHPSTGWTVSNLFARMCEPTSYIALAGLQAAETRALVQDVAGAPDTYTLFDRNSDELFSWPRDGSEREGQVELARVARRLQKLVALEPKIRHTPDCRVVSDFWINQTLAIARVFFEGSMRERIEHACLASSEAVRVPKMIFYLEPPKGTLPVGRSSSQEPHDSESEARQARFSEALRQQVAMPGQGPVIRVDGTKMETVRSEWAAALAAMT